MRKVMYARTVRIREAPPQRDPVAELCGGHYQGKYGGTFDVHERMPRTPNLPRQFVIAPVGVGIPEKLGHQLDWSNSKRRLNHVSLIVATKWCRKKNGDFHVTTAPK